MLINFLEGNWSSKIHGPFAICYPQMVHCTKVPFPPTPQKALLTERCPLLIFIVWLPSTNDIFTCLTWHNTTFFLSESGVCFHGRVLCFRTVLFGIFDIVLDYSYPMGEVKKKREKWQHFPLDVVVMNPLRILAEDFQSYVMLWVVISCRFAPYFGSGGLSYFVFPPFLLLLLLQ